MKDVYTIGDIHGNFNVLSKFINNYDIEDSVLIQVGDFHTKPNASILEDLQDFLDITNNKLIICRGNHDHYYNHYPEEGTPTYKHINPDILKFAKDYELIEIDGFNYLFIGGAISIDRTDNINCPFIWEKEKVKQLEDWQLLEFKKIDVMVTHTCANYFTPYHFNDMCYRYFKVDPTLEKELIDERQYLNRVIDIVKPRMAINGHFHHHDTTWHDDTYRISLSIDQVFCISDYFTKLNIKPNITNEKSIPIIFR